MSKISYYTKLTGTSFRQTELAKVKPGVTPLRAVARPENEYDKFAVEVQALLDDGWEQIGWIAKGKNQALQTEILSGSKVKIACKEITGIDKDTLGCNVSVEYGDDSALDPADMKDFEAQEVIFGDANVVYFDEKNHRAYDEDGHELLSGSRAEKSLSPEANLTYPAKALAKKSGAKVEDIMLLWDNNRDLAADHGTLIHKALEKYLGFSKQMRSIDENREKEHTAKNWMPEYLGEIVDKFVEKSGIKECIYTEVRIKSGLWTGIVDLLQVEGNEFILNDYKVTKKIKDVKYNGLGVMQKYTIQQNFYRTILEDSGLKCKGMYLWQWDGNEWTKHEVKRVDVKEYINE